MDLLATSGDIAATWTSPMIPKMRSNDPKINPFGTPITDDEISWISSLINIGAMIGPYPYSYIAEKLGRKVALLCIAIPLIVSYLIHAFSSTVYWYYTARILAGLSLGGSTTLLPMYIAEIAEDSNRGMLSVTLNIFWTLGNLIPYVLGPYLPVSWFNGILACIPSFFFVLFLIIAPESPYFLINNQKTVKAEKSLMKLRGIGKNEIESELNHIKSVLEHDQHGHFSDIFKTKICLKALGICLFLITAQQLSGINAVLFYTQEIFEEAGVDDIPADISAIVIGLVLFSSSFVTPFFADSAGRRVLLIVSELGMIIAHLSFGVYFYFQETNIVDVAPLFWMPLASLVFYIVMFNLGLGPISWTLCSELFSNNVKSIACSLISTMSWLSAFVITKFFNDLNLMLGKSGTFWFFGGACFLTFMFTFFCVPETKGKSFKEIQKMLS